VTDEQFLDEFAIYGRVLLVKPTYRYGNTELPKHSSDDIKERLLRMARAALPVRVERNETPMQKETP